MTRKIIPLNDSSWRFGSVTQKPFGDVNDLSEVSEWLPARVPGDVRLDLLRIGNIPDPFFARNNNVSQWVDSYDWWYVRELKLGLKGAERAFLEFDGIDYQSAVFVDGKPVGRQRGMFSSQRYELSRPIAGSSSVLAIRIWGSDALPKTKLSPIQSIRKQILAPLFTAPNEPYPDRYATLKCQMQFGWDFAPRLRTSGIWDDAQVVIVHSILIQDAWVKTKVKNQRVSASVTLDLDSDRDQTVQAFCKIRGKNFEMNEQAFVSDLNVQRGHGTYNFEFDIFNPRFWNPWDRGEPNVYELQVQIMGPQSAEALDSATTTFGIRSFELATVPGASRDSEPWVFLVNDQREFLRGANWVPLDAIPARLSRDDYAARLKQARKANINFLRVWGGGLKEKRAFYDLCDELGILVWQEFPFAGAVLDHFPEDSAFLESVRAECGAIVRALRNHPSLVVWCGGNEFNTRGNRKIVQTLRQAVTHQDGTRPFKPASPYRDESHNWRVWHHFANVREYRQESSPFLSEFGLQSVPQVESLKLFLPDDSLYPPNATWEYHNAELKKLRRYAQSPLPSQARGAEEIDAFIQATQRAQASGLQIAIEHMRRRKPRTSGVAVWQFNDPWPAISWSVVDYFGVPKLAYQVLRRAYSPVLVSFYYPLKRRRPGEIVQGRLWLINDLRQSFENVELTAHLNGKEIYARRVDIPLDSSTRFDALNVKLEQGENNLWLILREGEQILSENEYDLNYCDVGEINPLRSMWVTLGNRLMR